MSHQDPVVRAMMRAEKALKSARTHLRRVPAEMLDDGFSRIIDGCAKSIHKSIERVR